MNFKDTYNTVNKVLETLSVNNVLDVMEDSKEAQRAELSLRRAIAKQMLSALSEEKLEQVFLLSRKANQFIMNQFELEDLDEKAIEDLRTLLVDTANTAGQASVNRLGDKTFLLQDEGFIDSRLAQLVSLLTTTSLMFLADKIEQARGDLLTAEETMGFLKQEIEDASETRAKLTVRNEIAVVAGQTEYEVYRRSGVTRVRWITVLDERVCPICSPLDGKEVGIGGAYSSRGNTAEHPPIHINCRCFLGPVEVNSFNIWDGS